MKSIKIAFGVGFADGRRGRTDNPPPVEQPRAQGLVVPAFTVNIGLLAPEARGAAVIEVASLEDRIDLAAPEGFQVDWLVNPHPERGSRLAEAVRRMPWRDGRVNVWAACEFETMRSLRAYLRGERGDLDRDSLAKSNL